MSENTKKEKKIILPNDFERMIPEYHKHSLIYGEHIVRYLSAASLLKGKIVLDIASGSGYGTQILSREAKKVIGVDISEDSVEYAKQNYGSNNTTYLVGDGEKIPLPDKHVDVVVSFETIEHIEDYKQFMAEVKRVLKDDGLLVLSTPNDLEFAEGNHFHLHEFKEEELIKLTEEYFEFNTSYFQGTWNYTALLEKTSINHEFYKPLTTLNAAPLKPENYLYFFMLCSNRAITEKVQELAVISEHYSDRRNQEKTELTQNHIDNLEDQLTSARKYVKDQSRLTQNQQLHIEKLEAELNSYRNSKAHQVIKKLHRNN